MDDQGFFGKIYQLLTMAVGGLFSYFMYRQKKLHDSVELLDNRLDKVEINQAGYNKSVDYLIKKFDKLENNIEKMIEKQELKK